MLHLWQVARCFNREKQFDFLVIGPNSLESYCCSERTSDAPFTHRRFSIDALVGSIDPRIYFGSSTKLSKLGTRKVLQFKIDFFSFGRSSSDLGHC